MSCDGLLFTSPEKRSLSREELEVEPTTIKHITCGAWQYANAACPVSKSSGCCDHQNSEFGNVS
eukprot:6315029-Amphidinium_carterae.1